MLRVHRSPADSGPRTYVSSAYYATIICRSRRQSKLIPYLIAKACPKDKPPRIGRTYPYTKSYFQSSPQPLTLPSLSNLPGQNFHHESPADIPFPRNGIPEQHMEAREKEKLPLRNPPQPPQQSQRKPNTLRSPNRNLPSIKDKKTTPKSPHLPIPIPPSFPPSGPGHLFSGGAVKS